MLSGERRPALQIGNLFRGIWWRSAHERSVMEARKSKGLLAVCLTAVFLLSSAGAAPAGEDEIPFDEATIFFELNDTDGDLGIHALIDGEPWRALEIEDPKGRTLLSINVQGRLRRQGLTEVFFESAEPPFKSTDPDEVTVTPEEFFDRFPEGEYQIKGKTLEKDKLKSTAVVTHVMPDRARNIKINGVSAAENCDVVPLPAVTPPVTIEWTTSPNSHPTIGVFPQVPINIVKQQIVVEREEPTLLVFSVDLPPAAMTSFSIPEDFTDLGDEFKIEILLREESGNQTAVETCFELM